MSFPKNGPDPKPNARVRDPAALRAVHRAEHACRVCGASGWLEAHHLIGGRGRSDVAANLVLLCPRCHGRVEARDYTVRSQLRWRLRPAEVAYLVETRGVAWTDAMYPLAPHASGSRHQEEGDAC